MSYSLNSLKGGYIGDYIGDYYRGLLRGILGVQSIFLLYHYYRVGGPPNMVVSQNKGTPL